MADFQILQAVAAVKSPFSDEAHIFRDADIGELSAFEEGTFLEYLQRIRECDRRKTAEVKCLSADPSEMLRELDGIQGFAPVKCVVVNFGQSRGEDQRGKRFAFRKCALLDFLYLTLRMKTD